jgi:hypothetical protein
MRSLALLLAGLTLSACAGGPTVETAHMPLELVRAEGEAPRLGDVSVFAGGNEEDSPYAFSIYFEPEGDRLGKPRSVGWTVKLGDYCKDRPSWVQSVIIGPQGQVWKGFRVAVPAGPDRHQDWSSGHSDATGPGAAPTPGLVEAVTAGGRFTIALEDDEGQRWHAQQIDTLTPAQRQDRFEDNLEAFRRTDPATVPVRSGLLMAVALETPPLPSPPRSCPA